MPQLKILNALERESFDSPPVFNNVGRKKYFAIPSGLLPTYDSLRTPTNKAWLILMLGRAPQKDKNSHRRQSLDLLDRGMKD